MKKKLLYLFVLLFMGCTEESKVVAPNESEDKKINDVLSSVSPVFDALRGAMKGKDEVEMISYELVRDDISGEITLLNFQSEPFFPIAGREEYAKLSAVKYTVDCTINGKTTTKECEGKFSCGTAIAECLEAGGCATICQNPKPYTSIREADINFLLSKGLDSTSLKSIYELPAIDLERSRAAGSLSTVKLYTLIQ